MVAYLPGAHASKNVFLRRSPRADIAQAQRDSGTRSPSNQLVAAPTGLCLPHGGFEPCFLPRKLRAPRTPAPQPQPQGQSLARRAHAMGCPAPALPTAV